MRFKTKPTEIEANQWFPGTWIEGVCGDDPKCSCPRTKLSHVHTAHVGQIVFLSAGDWVVKEPDGTGYYPIKPDIFAKKYERVD